MPKTAKNKRLIVLSDQYLRSRVAERHKETRYDAIDCVNETFNEMTSLDEKGKLCFKDVEKLMNSLLKKIMNLK